MSRGSGRHQARSAPRHTPAGLAWRQFAADPAASPTAALGAPLPLARIRASVSVPVVACCGSEDHMVAAEELEPLADEVVELPGVGHYPQLERPEAILELIDGLRRRLPAEAAR